jgi:hypothetical protein
VKLWRTKHFFSKFLRREISLSITKHVPANYSMPVFSLMLCNISPFCRITVLLVGNHSAGKSSFVNWLLPSLLFSVCTKSNDDDVLRIHRTVPSNFLGIGNLQILTADGRYVGEKIQNESVAIETAGITIVRRFLTSAAAHPSHPIHPCACIAEAPYPARFASF